MEKVVSSAERINTSILLLERMKIIKKEPFYYSGLDMENKVFGTEKYEHWHLD